MDALIACGLAAPTGAWGNFLTKGLYDPRLFLWIWAFKGETITDLVGMAVRGVNIEPVSNSLVDHCSSLLLKYFDSSTVRLLWMDMRSYLNGNRKHGICRLWQTIRWRIYLPRLPNQIQNAGEVVLMCEMMTREWSKLPFPHYPYLRNERRRLNLCSRKRKLE